MLNYKVDSTKFKKEEKPSEIDTIKPKTKLSMQAAVNNAMVSRLPQNSGNVAPNNNNNQGWGRIQ